MADISSAGLMYWATRRLITMQVNWSGVQVEVVQGDIANQQGFDAVVNAANARLMPGGGVAGAIHRAAGPELEREATRYAPLQPGQAVITPAYQLPNQFVIHCLGPIYGVNKPEAELLASCYHNALKLADERNLDSIAFPAISTGIFSYPIEEAARVALRTVRELASELKQVKRIRFVLYDSVSKKIHEEVLAGMQQEIAAGS